MIYSKISYKDPFYNVEIRFYAINDISDQLSLNSILDFKEAIRDVPGV